MSAWKEKINFVSSLFDTRTDLFASGEDNVWAQATLLRERESLTRKIQGLSNQSDDKFMNYCGKTFQSGSFQKSPAPAILFRAQKVKQEQ